METDGASGRGGAGAGAGAGACGEWLPWREAAERALYGTGPAGAGPDAGIGAGARTEGFFLRETPAAHFRTSVHASPLFAVAVARLLLHVDEALGRPDRLALIDVGAGRGELLTGVLGALPAETAGRVRPYAVERAARPAELDERVVWTDRLDLLPGGDANSGEVPLCGLLFANEWLDDVPVDIAETDAEGVPRRVLVRTSDGAERLGDPVGGADAEWLERWWPLAAGARAPGASGAPAPEQGLRAEIGRPRDAAWAAAVRTLARGLAVAVDYAHVRADRPPFGTLTGYREGREVPPVPDSTCDLTAHVALDACAAAGSAATADRTAVVGRTAGMGRTTGAQREERRAQPSVLSQRAALHSLGIDGARPPLALASSDPAAYVRRLASAGEAAELTDPGGLGAFGWLVQPVGGVPSPFGPPR